MTQTQIKVLIVEDHPVFRRGLRQILEPHSCFKIVGEASDGESGLQLALELRPDIVIVDIDLPKQSGFEMTRELRRANSPVKLLFLTMYKDEDVFNRALDL